jgi:hypothetical protein
MGRCGRENLQRVRRIVRKIGIGETIVDNIYPFPSMLPE